MKSHFLTPWNHQNYVQVGVMLMVSSTWMQMEMESKVFCTIRGGNGPEKWGGFHHEKQRI